MVMQEKIKVSIKHSLPKREATKISNFLKFKDVKFYYLNLIT